MDFIPLPDNVTSHMLVPNLGGPEYDNLGFTGYDVRQGWSIRNLRLGRLATARDDWDDYESKWSCHVRYVSEIGPHNLSARVLLAAAFVQTWTLCGIFQEILGRPIMREELLSPKPHTLSEDRVFPRYISTRHAFSEFLSWKRSWAKDPSYVARNMQFLATAKALILGFSNSPILTETANFLTDVFPPLTALNESIYATLIIFNSSMISNIASKYRPDCFGRNGVDGLGWCPNLIRKLGDTASLYYASLVPGLISQQVHDRCSESLCVAFNVESGTYRTQHVSEICSCREESCSHTSLRCCCPSVAMPTVPFHSALESGSFPLIKLTGDELEVTQYRHGMSFVAISHPWSDGRGNPNTNSLPLCQLRAISNYIAANRNATKISGFENGNLFWMDTLCVPIEEPFRNSAILRMADVYATSRITLVLSADLMFVKRPSTTHETLLRISCSKWNTRLWLLHEAALARNLIFQFADGVVTHRDLHMKTLAAGINPIDHGFLLTVDLNKNHMNSMTRISKHGNSEFCDLENLWSGLRYRTSSRLLDATICASILLGSDLTKVLEASDEMKMQTFWACQSRIPYNMLFVDGQRLLKDGFHWAPSSLLDPDTLSVPLDTTFSDDRRRDGIPTACGLLISGVEVYLIKIPEALHCGFHAFRLKLPRKLARFYFWIDNTPGQPWYTLMNEFGLKWDGICVVFLSGLSISRAALVIPQETVQRASHPTELTTDRHAIYAVQVEFYHEDGSGIYRVPKYRKCEVDSYFTEQKNGWLIDVDPAESIGPEQRWCIH